MKVNERRREDEESERSEIPRNLRAEPHDPPSPRNGANFTTNEDSCSLAQLETNTRHLPISLAMEPKHGKPVLILLAPQLSRRSYYSISASLYRMHADEIPPIVLLLAAR